MILVSFFLPETGAYEFDTQMTVYGSTKKLHFFRLQLLENRNLDFILFVLQKWCDTDSTNISNDNFLPDRIFEILPMLYLNATK